MKVLDEIGSREQHDDRNIPLLKNSINFCDRFEGFVAHKGILNPSRKGIPFFRRDL